MKFWKIVDTIFSPECSNNFTNFFFQRINLLYRPTFEAHVNHSARSRSNHRRRNRRGNNDSGVVLTNYNAGDRFSGPDDPPPKYTPPPSYSTATGARYILLLHGPRTRS